MRHILHTPPSISGDSLTPEQIAAARYVEPPAPVYCTREEIRERIATCRACEHVSQACSVCDLRCGHPAAVPGQQAIALAQSTCPSDIWPTSP
jgi:hypothetical protein